MFCRSCGKNIPEGSDKCPVCGAVQTITELEYQTGAKSRAGAAVQRFREEPAARQIMLLLEIIGILLGISAVLFALLFPGVQLGFGHRTLLVLLGGTASLGFGILLCRTLLSCGGSEV